MDKEELYNTIVNSDDFKKVKMNYRDFSEDDLFIALMSIGMVAANNAIFKSLFQDLLKNNNGKKD